MYLKRKTYQKLLSWKAESNLTLEVTGARQVGKTYIIRKFAKENFDAVVYINMLEASGNIFCCVARILAREKKGLDKDNFSESLQKLVVHDYDSNISKSVCNRAIMWLQSAGILDFAGKVSECRVMDFKGRCRCYFTDLGLAYYFFRKIGASSSDMQGMLHENFVFLELRRRAERLKEGQAISSPSRFTGFQSLCFKIK